MTTPTPEHSKIQSLEGLRGVMAWWVVLGHLSLTFGWHLPLIDQNRLAVDVFILLSGFVIALLIDRKAEPYLPYITRRAFRIFPLYLTVLLISALALPVQLSAWSGASGGIEQNAARAELAAEALANLPAHLAAHIPLLQGLIPKGLLSNAAFTIVGQAWSVSLEWQFYLVAPFLMWAVVKPRRWVFAVLFVALLWFVGAQFPGAFLGNRIFHFLVGIGSYLALQKSARAVWAGLAVVSAIVAIAANGLSQILPMGIWAIVIISTAMASHRWIGWPARLLSSPIAVHFGEMSYSVYLVHMLPLFGSLWIFQTLGQTGAPLQAAVTVCTLVGAYLISWATYRALEKPSNILGAQVARRFGPREPVAA